MRKNIEYTSDLELGAEEGPYVRALVAVQSHPVFSSLLSNDAVHTAVLVASTSFESITNKYQSFPGLFDAFQKSPFRMFGDDSLRELASIITIAWFPSLKR